MDTTTATIAIGEAAALYFRDLPFSSSNQLSTTINLSGVLLETDRVISNRPSSRYRVLNIFSGKADVGCSKECCRPSNRKRGSSLYVHRHKVCCGVNV